MDPQQKWRSQGFGPIENVYAIARVLAFRKMSVFFRRSALTVADEFINRVTSLNDGVVGLSGEVR